MWVERTYDILSDLVVSSVHFGEIPIANFLLQLVEANISAIASLLLDLLSSLLLPVDVDTAWRLTSLCANAIQSHLPELLLLLLQ